MLDKVKGKINLDNLAALNRFKSKLTKASCAKKNGFLKVREADENAKEVPLSFAQLNSDRFTYYLDPVESISLKQNDQTSILGSIQLKDIRTPIQKIDKFPSCFEMKTLTGDQNSAICTENEKTANEWISLLTQNVINCN